MHALCTEGRVDDSFPCFPSAHFGLLPSLAERLIIEDNSNASLADQSASSVRLQSETARGILSSLHRSSSTKTSMSVSAVSVDVEEDAEIVQENAEQDQVEQDAGPEESDEG